MPYPFPETGRGPAWLSSSPGVPPARTQTSTSVSLKRQMRPTRCAGRRRLAIQRRTVSSLTWRWPATSARMDQGSGVGMGSRAGGCGLKSAGLGLSRIGEAASRARAAYHSEQPWRSAQIFVANATTTQFDTSRVRGDPLWICAHCDATSLIRLVGMPRRYCLPTGFGHHGMAALAVTA